MKITKLYTGQDNRSYFEDIKPPKDNLQALGLYSSLSPATGIMFRETLPHKEFDWHNAPRTQYIIYLEGEVEVQASGGETRIFKPGDILLATDLTGKGHISRSLSAGYAIIVTCD